MPTFSRKSPWPARWPLWTAVGLALRLVLIWFPRPGDDDTADYLELGRNLLHRGVYGMGAGSDISPSLFRLPAYPIVLATFERVFAGIWPHAGHFGWANGWLNAVFLFQAVVDIFSCLLVVGFVQRHVSERAAQIALPLAMLCPFTAAFVGIALTESLSVFAVALGLYAAGRSIAAAQAGERDVMALLWAGFAAGFAAMLRPDGALLGVVLAGGLFFYTWRADKSVQSANKSAFLRAIGSTAIYCSVALLPTALWTARNWAEFRVFQPLAPRYLNDPGDNYNAGFYRWMRTWTVDFASTGNVFWSIGSDPITLADLPSRAFDSPAQRALTGTLLDEYNRYYTISPQLDARFAALAAERIHHNPLRYYLIEPWMRACDMMLRPRTWSFGLDVYWWRWSEHPGESSCAILLGLVNLAYVGLAVWGFMTKRVPFALMLGGYLLLRCGMLGTLENPEPRYTVVCFPILIIAAATALAQLRVPRLALFEHKGGNSFWRAFHPSHTDQHQGASS